MQKVFYTSVSNADLHSGKKGCTFRSDPIPLLKENFLGEFRSNLEKQKVRKNLGIPDEVNLRWENIQGNLDEAPTLLEYIKKEWNYSTPLYEDVTNVKEALDKTLEFIKLFKSDSETINDTATKLTNLINNFNTVSLTVASHSEWIEETNKTIESINNTLKEINNLIKISEEEDNAIIQNEDGLYVKDLSSDILDLQNAGGYYKTDLEDSLSVPVAVGGIDVGTRVSDLEGKSINQLLDQILFPTVLRKLIYPSLSFNMTNQLVEVGTPKYTPSLTFIQGDAGNPTVDNINSLIQVQPSVETTYDQLSKYTYTASVNYNAGEYLVDNKGITTTSRIEAGNISAEVSIQTTYPWYADGTKQKLVPFDTTTEVEVSLAGNSEIKLPGLNTQLQSFKVEGMAGYYLDVNLEDWDYSTEELNGTTYKVWKKKSSYSSILNHKLKFILKK